MPNEKNIPKNCSNCCYGTRFDNLRVVVCGHHICNFSFESFCEYYKSEQQRFAEIQEKIRISKLGKDLKFKLN